jgi:hypothetical protein
MYLQGAVPPVDLLAPPFAKEGREKGRREEEKGE